MRSKVPIVAIVGRANVGKSSLFNLIIGRREAIVAFEPGTTRDSITAKASYNEHDFWLVDTAGMKDPDDDFELTIQQQIIEAADAADIIMVVVEADVPPTEEDRRVANLALKSKKPVFLVINKAERQRRGDVALFQKLGIKDIFQTSVPQRMGIEELLGALTKAMPKRHIKESDNRIHVALLGRPNVGKSYLFNTLAKKQQAIVADRAGTTRDVNRTIVKFEGREFELMDTAGIRRSGKIEVGIEKFSVIRSLQAIEDADVALLLVDVNEPATQLDQKIGGLIKEAGKGMIIVVSKWDSVEKTPFTRDQIAPKIQREFVYAPWASLVFTSAVTGQNVAKLFELVLQIIQNRERRIPTPELNRWLRKTVDMHPPAGLKNRHPRLNYITQTDDEVPTFKVFGAHTDFLHWSYKRHMERTLRETFDFTGTPVRFNFYEKH